MTGIAVKTLHRTLRIVFIIAIIVAIAAIFTAFEALNARPFSVPENDLNLLNSSLADNFALVGTTRTRSLDSLSDLSERKREPIPTGIKSPNYDGKNYSSAVDGILASMETSGARNGKSAGEGNLSDLNELGGLVAWADGTYEKFMAEYEEGAYSIYRDSAIEGRSDYISRLGYDELIYTLRSDIIWYREFGSIYFKNSKEALYKTQSDTIRESQNKALSVERKTRKDLFADLENEYTARIDSQIDRWIAGWKMGKFTPKEQYEWLITIDDISARLGGFEKFDPPGNINFAATEVPPAGSAAWLESEREVTKILESGRSK